MTSRKTSVQTEARRRARQAKATLDAERVEHDRQVETATTAFYTADLECQRLTQELETAQDERSERIATLLDLEETPDRVATLTGATIKDIKASKRHRTTTKTPAQSPAKSALEDAER